MFSGWLSGDGLKPHTWAKILEALKSMEFYKEFIEQVNVLLIKSTVNSYFSNWPKLSETVIASFVKTIICCINASYFCVQ